MKAHLTKLHRKIFLRLKKSVEELEVGQSEELMSYKSSFHKFSQQEFKNSTSKELFRAIDDSHIVYMGDFHTFDQNSKNMERVLKYLLEEKDHPILGMEMISFKDQHYIDAYLSGDITEAEFLDSIQYHHSWRFPWSHYKYFFDIARKKKLKIVGLNSSGSLSQRDTFASAVISGILQNNIWPHQSYDESHKKILVLFGELHITPMKIPALVEKQFRKEGLKQTIIQQNIDEIYWQSPQAKIVKFHPRVFAIQSSPPWTKYDSQLYWYDHLADDPEFDLHEYFREVCLKKLSEYSIDSFVRVCSNTRQSFGFFKDDLDLSSSFSLVDSTKLAWLTNKLEQKYSKREVSFLKKLITENTLLRFPGTSYLYTPSYSLNRLAYLAGIHLYGKLFNLYFGNDRQILNKTDEQVYCYFFHTALWGYLSSKIYNPFRKCDLYLDLKDKLKKENIESHIVRMTIEILEKPEEINEIVSDKKVYDIFKSSQYLGHLLGDGLFRLFQQNNEFDQFSLLSWHFTLSSQDIVLIKDLLYDEIDILKERKRMF